MMEARVPQWPRLLLLVIYARGAVAVSVINSPSSTKVGESLALLRRGRISLDLERQDPISDLLPGGAEEKRKRRVMGAINQFRAQICSDMHKEHGVEFKSYQSCVDFMKGACKPGKDKVMDGDKKEITSGHGYCEEFFDKVEKKAEKKIEDEDAAALAPGPAPSVGPAPAPTPQKVEAPAAATTVSAGAAPAPSPFGAPAGPAPAPFIPGVSPGKPSGPIAKDEKWYYKKSDKKKGNPRMHMDEKQKLPTNGYFGKLVEHNDQKTSTGDWQEEWQNDSFDAFCAKHPKNPWCESKYKRSAASCWTVSATLVLVGIVNFAP